MKFKLLNVAMVVQLKEARHIEVIQPDTPWLFSPTQHGYSARHTIVIQPDTPWLFSCGLTACMRHNSCRHSALACLKFNSELMNAES